MSSIRIRAAQPSDIAPLVDLMSDFYADSDFVLDRAKAAGTFQQLIRDPRLGCVWLAFDAEKAAGFVVLTLSFSMEYGALRGFVDDLFVLKDYRRRGIGTAALSEVRRWCVASGVGALLVETSADNLPAQAAYRSSGFVDNGRQLLAQTLGVPLHIAGP